MKTIKQIQELEEIATNNDLKNPKYCLTNSLTIINQLKEEIKRWRAEAKKWEGRAVRNEGMLIDRENELKELRDEERARDLEKLNN